MLGGAAGPRRAMSLFLSAAQNTASRASPPDWPVACIDPIFKLRPAAKSRGQYPVKTVQDAIMGRSYSASRIPSFRRVRHRVCTTMRRFLIGFAALCGIPLAASEFVEPSSATGDFYTMYNLGDSIDIQWKSGWNWGKGSQPDFADLFIMWFVTSNKRPHGLVLTAS